MIPSDSSIFRKGAPYYFIRLPYILQGVASLEFTRLPYILQRAPLRNSSDSHTVCISVLYMYFAMCTPYEFMWFSHILQGTPLRIWMDFHTFCKGCPLGFHWHSRHIVRALLWIRFYGFHIFCKGHALRILLDFYIFCKGPRLWVHCIFVHFARGAPKHLIGYPPYFQRGYLLGFHRHLARSTPLD